MSLLGGAIWHKWYEGCKLLIENGCGVEHPVFEGRFLDQHLLKEAWVCDTGDLAGDVCGNEILQEHFDSMMQLVAAIEQVRDGRRTYNRSATSVLNHLHQSPLTHTNLSHRSRLPAALRSF